MYDGEVLGVIGTSTGNNNVDPGGTMNGWEVGRRIGLKRALLVMVLLALLLRELEQRVLLLGWLLILLSLFCCCSRRCSRGSIGAVAVGDSTVGAVAVWVGAGWRRNTRFLLLSSFRELVAASAWFMIAVNG
jgi:hypothetical protein